MLKTLTMYKDYTVDANLITSTTFLAKDYPTLLLPFLVVLEELVSIEYNREVEHSATRDETRFEELCLKFAHAISELADSLGDDFIYVPYRIHYQIRHANVTKPVQTVNFLRPLMK